MQKINREALREDWEVPEGMFNAATGPRLTNVSIGQIEEIIKKAIRELCE